MIEPTEPNESITPDLSERETAYLAGMYDGMMYALERTKKAFETGESPEKMMKKKFWYTFLLYLKDRNRNDDFWIKRHAMFDGNEELNYWEDRQTPPRSLESQGDVLNCGIPWDLGPSLLTEEDLKPPGPGFYDARPSGGIVDLRNHIPLTCSCGSANESCEEDPNGYYSRFFITEDGPKRYLFELGTHQNGVEE